MKKIIAFTISSLLIISPLAESRQVSKSEFVEGMNILFLKENYASLIKNSGDNLAHYKLGRNEKKEVLYLTGLSYIKLGSFSKARETFRKILAMKSDQFRQDAYIGIADSYFYEKKFDKAIAAYEEVLNMYSKGNRLSSVYYNLGLSYKAKKNPSKANVYFQKIKTRYKTSFEADKVAYIPTRKKPNYYIIQLGAFKRLKNAKKLVRRLRRKRYDSYIQKVTKGGSVWYRVRAGKFSNRHYAMRLVSRLKRSRFYPKVIVE